MLIHNKFLIVLILILTLLLLSVSQLAILAKEIIKIGVIGPMTGPCAQYGNDMKTAILLAQEEINNAGGINGNQVIFIIEDDESNPSKSVSAAEKLCTKDEVLLVIGSYNSSCVLANMEVTKREKTPQIDPIGVATAITESGNEWICRNCATNPMQVEQLTNYVFNNMKNLKRFAVIHENTDYGVGIMEEFIKNANNYPEVKVLTIEAYNPGDTDFYAQLTKLKELNVDGIQIGGNLTEGTQIVRQAKELGLDVQFFGMGGLSTYDFEELVGDANDGMITSSYFETDTDNPDAKKFIEAYKNKFSKDPNLFSAATYEAAYLAQHARKNANYSKDLTIWRKNVKDKLMAIKNLPGVQGPTTFDEKGQADKKVLIIQWVEGGSKKILYP
ncbi:MAG: ABC transporter substrate-binding protein [Actinomycetia bacterium]|nr:ABC transporter substrate-binding protein [Actinomycetes bacterium]